MRLSAPIPRQESGNRRHVSKATYEITIPAGKFTNQSNIDGFLNMLVATRDAGVKRFVYAASNSTYGDHPDLPKVEDKIGKPLSPYAITKYVNELYADAFARTCALQSISLRYSNIFGPHQDPNGAYAAKSYKLHMLNEIHWPTESSRAPQATAKIVLGILCAVVILGIATRWYFIEHHFTHIDDIGVAYSIIAMKEERSERLETWRAKYRSGFYERTNPTAQKILDTLDQYGALELVIQVRQWYQYMHAVPEGWTYAPLQFYFTTFLINGSDGYIDAKFWGRFPSFLFGTFALVTLGLLLVRSAGDNATGERVLVGTTLLAFSWENIIYCAQMENYAIGIFSVTVLLLLLLWVARSASWSIKEGRLIGLVLALLVSAQYQILLFLPAFYLATAYIGWSQGSWKRVMTWGVNSVTVFIVVAIPLVFKYLWDIAGLGINWNAGPSHEFVLDLSGISLIEGSIRTITFFVRNLPIIVEAMLSPALEDNAVSQILGMTLVAASVIGFVSLVRSTGKVRRTMAIFVTVLGVTWALFVMTKMLAFSPTRHSMVLTPIWILLAVEGIAWLTNALRAHGWRNSVGGIHIFVLLITAVWTVVFAWSIPTMAERRIDPFSESGIMERLQRDQVDLVVNYDLSYAPYLMPAVRKNYPVLGEQIPKTLRNWGNKEISFSGRRSLVLALYSHIRPFSQVTYKHVLDAVSEKYALPGPRRYEVLKDERGRPSKTEIDWSAKTSNGTNGFYYAVVRIH